jgi:hypothetical protein
MKKIYIAVSVVIFVATLSIVLCLTESTRDRPVPVVENVKVSDVEETQQENLIIKKYDDWFSRDFTAELKLLGQIRDALINNTDFEQVPRLNVNCKTDYAWIAVSLFQEGNEPIRWISKRKTLPETLTRIVEKLRENERFSKFEVSNLDKCRIMLEVITSEKPLDIDKLYESRTGGNRFEPGITGLKLRYKDKAWFYMPTDAVINSHLLPKHALNFMSKKIGIAERTNKISERIQIMRELPIEWSVIRSTAFISFKNRILPLYRGYPMPVDYSEQRIYEMATKSVGWICDNIGDDGKFLYYYCGVKDSVIDHIHPNRTEENNYYNILRHNGGIIALLKMYELTADDKYITTADKALTFLTKQVRWHSYQGKNACYVFYNKKAKLGGTGTALIALMQYYQITKDPKYNDYIFGMAQHLLSRITMDGEMIGYYIHPRYNKGLPIESPSEKERKELFSFYYPGEALLGLALFEHYMDLTEQQREQIRKSAEKALDFLVNVRPVKYAELFEPLPSDGWLMQAIEEWAYDKQFQKKNYLDFVFNDAKQMISHMYTKQNALYYDYPGSFYYNYGDHAYVDGARAEGLIAAYYLAEKIGEQYLAQYIMENCKTVAKSLMFSFNSEESTYMHKYPNKSIGTFRFKLTRHWVRVDTVQHTSCFFVRQSRDEPHR